MVAPVRAMRRVPAFVLLVLAACGGGDRSVASRAVTPLDPAATGTITGTVGFDGPVPAMAMLPLGGEPICSAQHQGPVLAGDALVHDGRVENAFVYIKEGLGTRVFTVPGAAITIDQKGCLYRPRVAGAQLGQPITFVNSDALLHNVHGSPAASSPWNFGMGVQGSRRTITVEKPEVMIQLRCDVHPWMRAYLGVVDHPYFAVTGPDGRFTFPNVPAGTYTLATWHERFGAQEAKTTVTAKETQDVSFHYAPTP